MLAIFLAPIYILLNIYVLRWGYLWIGNCHHLFQSRIFRIILTVIYTLIALTPLTGFLIRKPAFLHRILKITHGAFFHRYCKINSEVCRTCLLDPVQNRICCSWRVLYLYRYYNQFFRDLSCQTYQSNAVQNYSR